MKLVFWCSVVLISIAYIVYPVLLFLVYSCIQIKRDLQYLYSRRDRRRRPLVQDQLPSITVVVAAYNEMVRLPAKIANIETIDYPTDKLKFIFVSDGSTDGTSEFLQSLRHPQIRAYTRPTRGGKSAALNDGISLVDTELLVLSDASTLFTRDGIRFLIRHFSDPRVGAACGYLDFDRAEISDASEGTYWSFECMLRLMEGRLGATLTASGAFYAIRKVCFPGLAPNTVLDDLMIPMHTRKLGYSVIYDPEAIAIEFPAKSVQGEFVRRVRLAAGSFMALSKLSRIPLRGFTCIAFLCHKVLRWIVPFLLVSLLISSGVLANIRFYKEFFFLQLLFYCWATIGYLLRNRQTFKLFSVPYFLVAMNIAFLLGFVRFVRNSQWATWERVG